MPKLLRTRVAKEKTKSPQVRFRMRVTMGSLIAVGPGKIELLEAIRETGSISAAGRAMDMSYRRAWELLDEINSSLKQPATTAAPGGRAGGGTQLTANGERIVALYRAIEAKAAAAAAKEVSELLKLLQRR
jgi:molybdate transport system regulatory protein